MKPIYVKYFDITCGNYVFEFIVRKDEARVYLCSKLTYNMSKKINKTEELFTIDTKSLPIDWCNYKEVRESENCHYSIPTIIKENEEEFIELINENFHFISHICDFIEEFNDYRCNRDFVRCCIIAWAITETYLSDELLRTLFHFVFRHFHEQANKNKLKLLMDDRISDFICDYTFPK